MCVYKDLASCDMTWSVKSFGVCACRGGVTMQQTCAVADESDDTTIGAVIGRNKCIGGVIGRNKCIGAVIGRNKCIAVIQHNSSIQ